jgi:hypothetical protein
MKKGLWIFGCFVIWFAFCGSAAAQHEKGVPAIVSILLEETPEPPETLYPLPDTGQTKCYNDTEEIACPSAGNDFYGQDAQFPRFSRSYTKLGQDGTELDDEENHIDDMGDWIMTRDNVTGLIWEVKTDANKILTYTWQEAQDFISALNVAEFGGFNDWRMPTRLELALLVNRSKVNPSIDIDWFSKTMSGRYWSSSSRASDEASAWRVGFWDGTINHSQKTTESLYVRAVRSEN